MDGQNRTNNVDTKLYENLLLHIQQDPEQFHDFLAAHPYAFETVEQKETKILFEKQNNEKSEKVAQITKKFRSQIVASRPKQMTCGICPIAVEIASVAAYGWHVKRFHEGIEHKKAISCKKCLYFFPEFTCFKDHCVKYHSPNFLPGPEKLEK